MSLRQSLEVAKWEFRRFVKPKQMLVSFVITLAAGAVGYGLTRLAGREERVVDVAVIGAERLALATPAPGASRDRLRLHAHPAAAADSLRALVRARELDGLLLVRGLDGAELVVSREPTWRGRLEARLVAARQAVTLRESNIDPARLAAAMAPMPLTTTTLADRGGRRARVVALVAAGIVLYGVFTAGAIMFVSVTGEKQLRVTEQMLSAVRPQVWMDGKILGVAASTLVSIATTLLGGLVFFVGRAIARDQLSWGMFAVEPGHFVLTVVFALLGYVFWLSFLAGIAATVDDPNTSTRGPLLFVPALFAMPAFMIVRHPDSVFARVMGLLPPSAPAVMPARLALTDVPWWEVALSLLLLALGAWALRRMAGRIFSVAMLLYGKEPSWGEVRRLARAPRDDADGAGAVA